MHRTGFSSQMHAYKNLNQGNRILFSKANLDIIRKKKNLNNFVLDTNCASSASALMRLVVVCHANYTSPAVQLICAERQYMPNSISMCQKVFSCCNHAQPLKSLPEFSATLLTQQRNHSSQFILLIPQMKDSLCDTTFYVIHLFLF